MSDVPAATRPDPLILTAVLDPGSTAVLQRLRDRHFPARLNIVPVHLTLFHHLPGVERAAITAVLEAVCEGQARIAFSDGPLRFLGRGVAVGVEAPGLAALRAELAARWTAWLTPQDRQPFRAHVTIQNKAPPAEAKALLATLQATGPGVGGSVVGLDLWHYRGGPWARAGRFPFAGEADMSEDPGHDDPRF